VSADAARGRRSFARLALCCLAVAGGAAWAQRAQSAATPSTRNSAEVELARRFVGVWQPLGRSLGLSSNPVLTPAAEAEVAAQTQRLRAGDMTADLGAQCVPRTMPSMTSFGAQEILADVKKITWIMEASNAIRWIWLDGRAHPPAEEIRPTAMGHSIARREGDTLVVDSVGFMAKSRMYVNRPLYETVAPSEQMHVVERMHLAKDGRMLVIERTVTDPAILAQPWVTTVRYERHDDWEIGEIVCEENNRTSDY